MLSTEQKKQIAGYMGLEVREGASNYVYTKKNSSAYLFNPDTDDELNYKVFKALVDECKKKEVHMMIDWVSSNLMVGCEGHTNFEPYIFEDEFNNESICLAYLAVMDA